MEFSLLWSVLGLMTNSIKLSTKETEININCIIYTDTTWHLYGWSSSIFATIMRILSMRDSTLLQICSILFTIISKIFSYFTQGNFFNPFYINSSVSSFSFSVERMFFKLDVFSLEFYKSSNSFSNKLHLYLFRWFFNYSQISSVE